MAVSKAAISGPSGSTQLPLVMPNNGERLNASAAHSPARSVASTVPMRAISQVESAHNAMNGSRTTMGASLPVSTAIPCDSHHDTSG